MAVQTESPTVVSARASMLEFLLSNHALDCPVCDKGGECELQDMVYKYGPRSGRHTEKKKSFHEKDYVISPVIVKNSNRCVQCMKCVRVCKEVVGRGVLGALGRGEEQEETSFFRGMLDCDQCGNCIEVCPVGCFMRLPYRYKSRPWDLTGADTVCPYCATGCRMVVEERDGEVVRSRAQLGVGINSETLCARGRFGYDFINTPERLTGPMIKKFGRLEPASWEETIDFIRDKLSSVNGDKIGGIASSRLTNEELYLFEKLFRTGLKSPHLDTDTRWDPAAVEAFTAATGMSEGGVSVFDCMQGESVLVVGTHLSDENPIVDYIVRRISGMRRTNVMIASPRAMKLDSSASVKLRHAPGAEGPLLAAIGLGLGKLNDKLVSHKGLAALRSTGPGAYTDASGVTPSEVEAVSRKLNSTESVSIIAGTGFLRFPEANGALAILVDALKAAGKSVRVLPVLDKCNSRGAWEMGVHPRLGPGYSPAVVRGIGAGEMMEAAASGRLEALYVIGEELVAGSHDEKAAIEALTKLKFLIVQDIFLTDTAKLADVLLPGASYAEKEGTFTNQEGRVQSIKRLIPPPGQAKSDLEIIGAVLKSFVGSAPAASARSAPVFSLIRKDLPMYTDVSLKFVNKKNSNDDLDNKAALVKASTSGPGAAGAPPAARTTAQRGPFTLVTGNHLFHSGRFSRRSGILSGLLKEAVVEISEEDAVRLGISSGEKVRVKGGGYDAVLTLTTKRGTRKGVAFIAENYLDVRVARFFGKGPQLAAVEISRA
jgi:NADH-quinone oxidoreductase subunit G